MYTNCVCIYIYIYGANVDNVRCTRARIRTQAWVSTRMRPNLTPGLQPPFIGWSNNHFNNLHFIIPLETN